LEEIEGLWKTLLRRPSGFGPLRPPAALR
jgi:hypothetical protein